MGLLSSQLCFHLKTVGSTDLLSCFFCLGQRVFRVGVSEGGVMPELFRRVIRLFSLYSCAQHMILRPTC